VSELLRKVDARCRRECADVPVRVEQCVRSLTSALLAEVARVYPVGWYAHSATGYCEWAAAVLSGLLRAELVDLVVGRRAEQRDDQLDLVVRCNMRALRAESFRHPNHRTVPRCTVVPPCSAWRSNALRAVAAPRAGGAHAWYACGAGVQAITTRPSGGNGCGPFRPGKRAFPLSTSA
jgi:hypothetical protein